MYKARLMFNQLSELFNFVGLFFYIKKTVLFYSINLSSFHHLASFFFKVVTPVCVTTVESKCLVRIGSWSESGLNTSFLRATMLHVFVYFIYFMLLLRRLWTNFDYDFCQKEATSVVIPFISYDMTNIFFKYMSSSSFEEDIYLNKIFHHLG